MGSSAPGWCYAPLPLNTFIAQSTVYCTCKVACVRLPPLRQRSLSTGLPECQHALWFIDLLVPLQNFEWLQKDTERQVRRTGKVSLADRGSCKRSILTLLQVTRQSGATKVFAPPLHPPLLEDVADAGLRQLIRSHRQFLLPFAQEKFSCQEWNLSLTSLTTGNI